MNTAVADDQQRMAMDSQHGHLIAAALALKAGKGGNAARVADAIVSTWQEIAAALIPIVGKLGVAALYRRSVHLSGQAHPWLLALQQDNPTAMDLELLKSLAAQQSSADASAGGGTLLETFHELLASLIGLALTERLLRSVWAKFLSGAPARDISP